MPTKLLFLLSCLMVFSTCAVQKSLVPLPDDGTSVYFQVKQKPFYHGVASGDPLTNSVILWTRVTPDKAAKVTVNWSVSTNSSMQSPVKTGNIVTSVIKDYTVKIDAKGLQPNTTYYYQFEAMGSKSPIGRTKTAAANGNEAVKLAVVSCSNYEAGYYNAFARIAERDDLNAVIHLGDYIYEYEPDGYSDKSLDRKHLPAKEITSLSDYRTRYAQYRLDKDFQKVHQMHPFITIWDDHEVANNVYKEGAQNHQAEDGDFMTRKEAAKQAYFEWLPVRDNATKDIYRSIRFGDQVDLIMLDERLAGRTYPVDSVGQAEFKDASRTMLGAKQLDWFKKELKNSKATWKIIGNQVIFSPLDVSGLGFSDPVNLDAWDGYPYERQQISQYLENNKIENVIITAGDTHSSWAFEVPNKERTKSIAVEFGTPSITSANSNEGKRTDEEVMQAEGILKAKNPHLKYADLRNHGYTILSLSEAEAVAEWYYVDKLNAPSDKERLAKRYVVKNGANQLTNADGYGKIQGPTDWLGKTVLSTLEYRCIGPTRGGRVTAVAGVNNEPSTYYMGATGGGVWKTDDYGITWKNISDGYFESPSIGAITIDQKNSETIYVGTGSDGLRSNVIAGKGVYKTTDGGKSWSNIGLKATGQIGAVEIHPENKNVVFVAAIGQAFAPNKERGLYRTKDGGKTWENVLFISEEIGVVDVEFAPDNPNVIYAAGWKALRKPWTIISGGMKEGGIYKSIDGGDTWNKIEKGIPILIGKIDLSVSPNDPSRVYALIEAPETDDPEMGGRGGFYRSDDYGENFELVSTKKELLDRPFYYCNIKADPQDADVIYSSATRFFKSIDAGKTWKRMQTPHGDNHDIWINPNDSNNFIQANDGGANVTQNGGKSWSTQFNQATSELYQIEVDDQYPYWVYAGQQDNYTTIALPSLPPYTIQAGSEHLILNVGGCETGPAVPKPGNPDIVYANCKGRFGVYNKKTGQEKRYYVGAGNMYGHNPKELKYRFQRVSPIHVSPHNPNVVYHCSQFVHKTVNDGVTWETISPDLTEFDPSKQVISGTPITRDITGEEFYSTIYSIQESKIQEGLIWVGANDGPVHVTKNGGADWKKVTPKDLLTGGRIDCVEPSVHKAGKAYFTSLRYQLGDWKPYVYKTENFGETWTLLTKEGSGIPMDYPVRVVREDPEKEGVLYAGTEYGLFISLDDGEKWHSFQQNLPVTPITDLKVYRKDLVISTMGRSFWILDDLTVLHTAMEELKSSEVHVFKPRDVHRLRYRGTSKNSIPYYPSNGVTIKYYLKEAAKGPISLDILNKEGDVVRSYRSIEPAKKESNKERNMSTEFSGRGATARLKTKAGLHEFRWDMRHEGVWDKDVTRSGRSGPMVVPNEYTVRFKVNGQTFHESFMVKIDPKVAASGTSLKDLVEQEELSLKVRDLTSSAKQTLVDIQKSKKGFEMISEGERTAVNTKKIERLEKLEMEFSTEKGRYQKPMLLSQLSYLRYMLGAADQKPGDDAHKRILELENRYKQFVVDYKRIAKIKD